MSSVPPLDAEQAAVAELARSRQHMRDTLHGIAHPVRHPLTPLSLKNGVAGLIDYLVARLRQLPGAAVVSDGVGNAWRRHPVRPAVETALARYRPVIERTARRQPGALLGVAFGAGALLWLMRPWRLLFRATVVARVLPAIARQVAGKAPRT